MYIGVLVDNMKVFDCANKKLEQLSVTNEELTIVKWNPKKVINSQIDSFSNDHFQLGQRTVKYSFMIWIPELLKELRIMYMETL